ncbi:hypothetical protein [Ruegeria denitrificans]|uniref:hypothetical protein n=1 Tax=Ruegeria denitrificans TaxID=1715692 RepID=UPI003C7CF4CE
MNDYGHSVECFPSPLMNAAAKQQRLNITYIGLIAGAALCQIGFRETFRPDTYKPGL